MSTAIITLTLASGIGVLFSFLRSLRQQTLTNRLIVQKRQISLRLTIRHSIESHLETMFISKKRLRQALFELPDFMELLAVALTSGESMYSAIRRVVPRMRGVLGKELTQSIRSLDFGSDLEAELSSLAGRLPQRQVIEFANKISLALRRGTPLAQLLWEQSESVRQEVYNQLTKQAGQNETRMLIPLVFLILPVTILFAIYPSLQLLNLNYL